MTQLVLSCQLCSSSFFRVHAFKEHLRSEEHAQVYLSVFLKEKTPMSYGIYPNIVFADRRRYEKPIVGVSLLTLCYGDQATTFYLCHVCEVACQPKSIMHHLSTGDHYVNYFNYTDPNKLTFSWTPCMDMRKILKPHVFQEFHKNGPGMLQILTLPVKLLRRIKNGSYSKAMNILGGNQRLFKVIEASKPQRNTFQKYQRDRDRTHPLLGMQDIIELICSGQPEKRHYLCTLCKQTVGTKMIMRHILSFDHVYCYLKVTHPSAVLSKYSYLYSLSITSIMLDLVRRTEEMYSVAETEKVTVDPAEFAWLSSTDFAHAMMKLAPRHVKKSSSHVITDSKPRSSSSTDLKEDAAKKVCQKVALMRPKPDGSDKAGGEILEGAKEKEIKIENTNEEILKKTHLDMMMEKTEVIKEEGKGILGTKEKEQENFEREKKEPVLEKTQVDMMVEGTEKIKEEANDIKVTKENEIVKMEQENKEANSEFSEKTLVDMVERTEEIREPVLEKTRVDIMVEGMEKIKEEANDIKVTKEKEIEKMEQENKEPNSEVSEKTLVDMVERTEKIKEEPEEIREINETTVKMEKVENGVEEERTITKDVTDRIVKEDEAEVPLMEHISEFSNGCETRRCEQESTKDNTAHLGPSETEDNDINMSNSPPGKQQKMQHGEAVGGVNEPKPKCFGKDAFHEESEEIQSVPTGKSLVAVEIKAETEDNQTPVALWEYIKKSNRKPVIGLCALLECNFEEHCPIYLCHCCCQRITERDIVSHVTGKIHWKKYLSWSERVPDHVMKQKMISRQLVAFFECCEGPGEAQVIDVDEKLYWAVLTQPFDRAMEALRSSFPLAEIMPNKLPKSSATVSSAPQEQLQSSAPSDGAVHTSPSTDLLAKSPVNIEPKKKIMEVGKGECIVVRCQKRQQVYCKLCRERLKRPGHLSSHTHLSNYVKQKFGHDTSTDILEKITPYLFEIEQILGTKKGQIIEVKRDEYDALAALCTVEALEKVEMLLQDQMDLQVPSVSTTNKAVAVTSSETPCPDDEILVPSSQKPAPKTKCCPKQNENYFRQLGMSAEVTPSGNVGADKTCTDTPSQFQACMGKKNKPDDFPNPVVENTQKTEDRPQNTDTVATHTQSSISGVVQTPLTNQKTNKNRHEQLPLKKHEEASPVLCVKEKPPSDNLQIKEQRNSPGTNLTPENRPSVSLVPDHVSQERCRRSSGDGNQTNTSKNSVEPEMDLIIGRHFIWKCVGPTGNSFYLCESCKETIFTCPFTHMSRPDHWLAYLKWQHPSFLQFWDKDEYPLEVKRRALRKAAIGFSRRESFYNPSFRNVTVGPHLYEYVKVAPFTEALKIVQGVETSAWCPPPTQNRCPEQRINVDKPEAPKNHTSIASSQQGPASSLGVRHTETHSKSTSVQRSMSQESQGAESSQNRKRLAATAPEAQHSNNIHTGCEGPLPAKRSVVEHSGTRRSTASVSNSCLPTTMSIPPSHKKTVRNSVTDVDVVDIDYVLSLMKKSEPDQISLHGRLSFRDSATGGRAAK